jgi:DNA polymerase-3 subunit gamma/tau
MLSMSAFNALLKILEEPPEHILFILATTELHKVPATIQSRCQKFSFKRLSPTALAARLMYISNSEGFTLTEEAAARLTALADGSMRDGISLLDQCVSGDVVDLTRVQDTLGLVGNQDLLKLVDLVAARNVLGALSILNELYDDGRDMTSLLSEMTAFFRDLLIFKISPDSGLLSVGLDKSSLSVLSGKFSSERLFFCLDLLKNILSSLSRSGSSKLVVEMCLIRMCRDTILTSAVSAASADEVRGSAQSITAKKSPEESHRIDKDSVAVAVNDAANEGAQPGETDEASPCSAENGNGTEAYINETDEPSPCSDFWAKILEVLRREPSVRVLINDSSKVMATLQDKSLTVSFTDSHTAEQIKHGFSELIKDAAEKVLGYDVILSINVVESADNYGAKHSKLDGLSAFVTENFN